jgi:hypothetical protein
MPTMTPLQHRIARAEKRAIRQHADASHPRFNHRSDGAADLGRNLRDRHPEIFAKAEPVAPLPIVRRSESQREIVPPARRYGMRGMVGAMIAMALAPMVSPRGR